MRFPDGSDMQPVPEDSMMTYGVLIELGRTGQRMLEMSLGLGQLSEDG